MNSDNKEQEGIKNHSLKFKFLVEVVGTFILVYAICSARTVYADRGQLGIIGIGLVHALALTAIIYAIGYRSGAQVYIIAQLIGAVIAASVVYSIFGSEMSASVTLPFEDNVVRALILETVVTFTLVYVVLATTTSRNFKIVPLAGVAIGFTLGFNVMFGAAITGGSLNPVRSFGPALITGNFEYNWIYWVAPIIGGLIAAGVYKGLHKDTDLPAEEQIKQ
jgi:glycerol uptake facilitator-like aquaporin